MFFGVSCNSARSLLTLDFDSPKVGWPIFVKVGPNFEVRHSVKVLSPNFFRAHNPSTSELDATKSSNLGPKSKVDSHGTEYNFGDLTIIPSLSSNVNITTL